MEIKNIKAIFIIASVLVILSIIFIPIACDNAGGEAPTEDEDITPPTVESVQPQNGATDVAVNTTITATFSEEMDETTITTDTFTVSAGASPLNVQASTINGTVGYSDRVATFTPDADLAFETAFTVTITTGVKDVAGNALAEEYSWSFTTGVEQDTTGPSVSGTTPADGATNVELDSTITVTFDEPVSAATLTADTFLVKRNGIAIQGNIGLNQEGTTATFTPSSDLSLYTQYSATVTTGVEDLTGNTLASDYTWSFNTRDGAWGSTIYTISSEDYPETATPQVAFDAPGKANVVWSYDISTGYAYYSTQSNRYEASGGSSWLGEETRSSDVMDWNNTEPQIASNMTGTSFAVWKGGSDYVYFVYGARFSGDVWEVDVKITSNIDNSSDFDSPQVAVDSDGNAIAVWREYTLAGYAYYDHILASRFDETQALWSIPSSISFPYSNSQDPQVSAGSTSGDTFTVWVQDDGVAEYYVYAAIYDADGASPGWTAPVKLSSQLSSGNTALPQVAVDLNGNAIAVWKNTNIYANFYDATSESLQGEIDISGATGDNPQIAFDASGNAIAVWDGGTVIYAKRYEAGTTWSNWDYTNTAPKLISASDATARDYPKIAVDPSGNALAIWREGPSNIIYFNRFRSGSPSFEWVSTSGETLKSDPDTASDFQIAVGPGGRAIAVWTNFDGSTSNYSIAAKVFE